MKRLNLVVDANLLLLFIVGLTNRDLIARHKRLKAYSAEDFDLLREVVASSQDVIVTPNTLTETSNLLGYIEEPARTRLFQTFRDVIGRASERYIESRVASEVGEFLRLGLTDCALLRTIDESLSLLTTDLQLYLSTKARGAEAVNFNHLRELRWERSRYPS